MLSCLAPLARRSVPRFIRLVPCRDPLLYEVSLILVLREAVRFLMSVGRVGLTRWSGDVAGPARV